jgi:hypothetical protein
MACAKMESKLLFLAFWRSEAVEPSIEFPLGRVVKINGACDTRLSCVWDLEAPLDSVGGLQRIVE